ncbi:helix-turn-helix domain-containing protein [Alicyclobacillus tolerans]|uniref:helix-turn-helix domain-containing protein n=1 Tax=Alicyclobacillus tolerans TaxID=90970 RepID=UPI001F24F4B8|nr:helix-turn-helix domain-containing protein [Alicyclobacillus tolerans]MCF8568327.1 helix-turn-helix domain-containing protein [Alicyclobacillus tolerans]
MTTYQTDPTRIEVIWGSRLLDEGFTSIPNLILRNYRKLGIEHGEWGLICTLLSYKHDARDPFPAHETLATSLCVSERQIRKWIDSLVAKGLLRIGRRRHTATKQFGPMVYNFGPLIDRTLVLVGDRSASKSGNKDYEIEYNNPLVPQVPVGDPAVLQVQNLPEPEVPLKRLVLKNKDTITTTMPSFVFEYTNAPEKNDRLDNTSISEQPTDSSHQAHSMAFSSDIHQASSCTSKQTSTTGLSIKDKLTQRDLNPYEEIEIRMQAQLQRPYIAKENDYRAIKELLVSGVPLDWILDGVDRVFEMRQDSQKRIHGFSYVAEVLKDEWAKELVKNEEVVQPIDFKNRAQNPQRDVSSSSTIKTRRPTTDSYTAVVEHDARYEAFYRLFPNG